MEQLRKGLAWLKRHHFWVLSVVVAAIAFVSWYSGSGTLQQEAATNQAAIIKEFNDVRSLGSRPFHANETIQSQQLQQIESQSQKVEATWQELYDRQREEVLQWPSPPLSQQFKDYVDRRQFGDTIPANLRDNYLNYVSRHFEELPKRVSARIMPEDEGGAFGRGGFGGRSTDSARYSDGPSYRADGSLAEEEPEEYVVEWLDQYLVRQELNFPQRPSSLQIWVTQENLWVYHTLLAAIANTNEAAGSDRPSNAAVRVIQALEVGRPAAQASRAIGRIMMLQAPVAADPYATGGTDSAFDGDGRSSDSGMDGPMGFGEQRGDGTGSGRLSPEQERAMLLSWRYLDPDGKPIPVGEETASAGPGEFGVEYKRLPIRMTLEMDQRWLNYLIAQCASQPLQVEVREVRINPPDLGTGGGRGGWGDGGGRGGYGDGAMGGSPFPNRLGQVQAFPQQPHQVTVVIQGIIYIFNEPNRTVLQPEGQVAGI